MVFPFEGEKFLSCILASQGATNVRLFKLLTHSDEPVG
jgi:hypothetical protein